MPELPEIETIKRDLEKKVRGKKVKEVMIKNGKCLKEITEKEFIKRIKGKVFSQIRRRGKFLIIELDSKDNLVIHLRMTGILIYSKEKRELNYTRIVFIFEDSSQLTLNDMRGFGNVWFIPRKEFQKIPLLHLLGPEPLEENFTLEKFKTLLKRKKKKIKILLMDQRSIAGIGNIYSQEALFRAGIHPEKLSNRLFDKEIEKLYNSLRGVLQEAISHRGSSVDTYVDLEGEEGKYGQHLKVYGRKGKKCLRCGEIIKKINLGGRGTYFCPHCQI